MCLPPPPAVMAGLVPAIHDCQLRRMELWSEYSAFVYIRTNKPNGILYVGVTNDILRRASVFFAGELDPRNR